MGGRKDKHRRHALGILLKERETNQYLRTGVHPQEAAAYARFVQKLSEEEEAAAAANAAPVIQPAVDVLPVAPVLHPAEDVLQPADGVLPAVLVLQPVDVVLQPADDVLPAAPVLQQVDGVLPAAPVHMEAADAPLPALNAAAVAPGPIDVVA